MGGMHDRLSGGSDSSHSSVAGRWFDLAAISVSVGGAAECCEWNGALRAYSPHSLSASPSLCAMTRVTERDWHKSCLLIPSTAAEWRC